MGWRGEAKPVASRRARAAAALLAGLVSFGMAWGFQLAGWLAWFEAPTVDWRFRWLSQPERADPRIVIVNIGEVDLAAGAREFDLSWPWPRQVYAEFLDRLAAAKPRAVFFDIFFTEQSSYSAADDRHFARAIREHGNVYLATPFHTHELGIQSRSDADLTPFALPGADDGTLRMPAAFGVTPPYRVLRDALADTTHGAVNVQFYADEDKIGRHYPLVTRHAGAYFPSIALRILSEREDGSKAFSIRDGEFRIGGRPLATETTRVWREDAQFDLFPLRFHGDHRTYTHVGFVEAMSPVDFPATRLKEVFQDRIVLVGSDAPALLDLRPSPFDEMSGVEFHATAIDNLLNGDHLHSISPNALLLLLLAAALATSLLVAFASGLWASLLTASLVLSYSAVCIAAFRSWDLRLEWVAPTLAVGAAFAITAMWRSMTERRRQREARFALEHFLPAAVVRNVLGDLGRLRLGGKKQEISVFFSDLEGFTDLSERLDPETLVDLINEYLTSACSVLHEEGATIDKYVGDAIVAFWGAPLAQQDHALRACRAALHSQAALIEFNASLEQRGLPPLAVRIGIHTGEAVVGFMGFRSGGGAGGRFNYTMMGDAVNLGSRLEGVNKAFGTTILISGAAVQCVSDKVEVRELGRVRVQGRQEPTAIFELLALKGELPEAQATLRDRFQDGLELYRKRGFEEARARFEACLDMNPKDGPSLWYWERCLEYEEHPPPPAWEAVTSMSKF